MDKLKVIESKTDQDKINYLCYKVFYMDKDGKELLKHLEKIFVNVCAFPTHPDILRSFGSTKVYAGFKSGQANVVKWIKQAITVHSQGKK